MLENLFWIGICTTALGLAFFFGMFVAYTRSGESTFRDYQTSNKGGSVMSFLGCLGLALVSAGGFVAILTGFYLLLP